MGKKINNIKNPMLAFDEEELTAFNQFLVHSPMNPTNWAIILSNYKNLY